MAALDWFRKDQRASGLSIRQYERLYGIFLSSPESDKAMGRLSDIRDWELPLSPVSETIGARPHCQSCAEKTPSKRRTVK
jgi:hypothetical protein